ncbi:MAG TPA: PDZ domain-containing protein, partial [Terriglobales bacterium]|nr:PDZ domain-containing protein [Terriglobales bacterium]
MKTGQTGTTRTPAFPPTHILRSARHAAALLLLCVAIAPSSFADVRYVISLADPQRHLVQVTMEIPAGRDSHELQLPVWNALYQVRDFSKYMDWIRAETATGQPIQLMQINQSRWKINGTAQGARVLYEMFSDDPGSYGAQLNAHHAFFNLAEILLYADDLRDGAVKVAVKNLPSQWRIATPLQQQGSDYTAQNYDRLVDSPIEAGTFEEQDFAGPCGRYQVVLDWEVAQGEEEAKLKAREMLAAIVPPVQRIVASASAWMNDCPFKQYMFIYHASESPGTGGMEHAYSNAITLSEKDFTGNLDNLLSVTSHEFFHLWNVKRIRPQAFEPVDYTKENYTAALWFSEGVDSTVGEYIRLRAGLLDEQHYMQHLSEELTELENRPAHLTQSVEQSSLDAWLEKYPYYGLPDRSISYYNKGELLGVVLDLAMREASNGTSLSDLFRWMNEHYAKQGKFFGESVAVREAAETISHADLHEFFQKYVGGTEEIPWDNFFARVGLHVVRSEVKLADPGFEAVQKFDQPPAVVEVQPGSSAERAGLKTNDQIVQLNGKPIAREFDKELTQVGPGEVLRLSVRRDG